MPSNNGFLALSSGVFLKELEFAAVYSAVTDELYEVDRSGFSELSLCDGTLAVESSRFPRTFLEFCLEEGLLQRIAVPVRRPVPIGRNETPSLRYLLLEVTDRCNLACRHCYLGETRGLELAVEDLRGVMAQFDDMGGLRLVVTGGEPTLHPGFADINRMMADRLCRTVLVTNGTLLTEELCEALEFHEVQVSLDGMERGHDGIRGAGSFYRALEGIECLRRAGGQLSVATMIHRENVKELGELDTMVRGLGAVSWTLDVPCEAGMITSGGEGVVPAELEEAADAMGRAFGSEQHRPSGDYACGAHLACLKAGGVLSKCGFYEGWNGGPVSRGLREAWLALPRMKLEELDCRCEHLSECGGGCRFRAETRFGRTGPDPLKCAQFGVPLPG